MANARIQFSTADESKWNNINPDLREGELVIVKKANGKYKLYVGAPGGSPYLNSVLVWDEDNAESLTARAETAVGSAESSATAAASSATAAATSETNAASSASTASSKANAAAKSESNAASSATAANQSATNASNSASTATTQANAAADSATEAANSASAASTSAGNAASSATAAAGSATNAKNSADAAAASAASLIMDDALSSSSANAVQNKVITAALAGKQPIISNAGYHNGIFRGKYLGASVTSAQWAAIKAGTFDDLYIGDYWTINDVEWVIVAFDYYYNTGDTACTAHHVVVVPRTILYSAQMNTSNVTTGAYVGSAMYTSNLASAKTTITNAFGSAHILTIRQHFQNAVTDGYESGGTWYDASVWLMAEANVYGGNIFKNVINGTGWPNNYSIDNRQYPYFSFMPPSERRQTYWLRDVAFASSFASVGGYGNCGAHTASASLGVRPAFCIYQS